MSRTTAFAKGLLIGVLVTATPATASAGYKRLPSSGSIAIPNVYDGKKSGEAWYELSWNAGVGNPVNMTVHIRDTRSDGWCARTRVGWDYVPNGGIEVPSAVIQDCAGVWRTVAARPADGSPIPVTRRESVRIFAQGWSGPLSARPVTHSWWDFTDVYP